VSRGRELETIQNLGRNARTMIRSRRDPKGLHYFSRDTGLNVLLDEVSCPPSEWSVAPRHVSIALTNACDMGCRYCYAPKHRSRLDPGDVLAWARELDSLGCFGIGFGGGEPTLYPGFAPLCRHVATETGLSVSVTTHGHRFTQALCDDLRGCVHLVRVSMDGIGKVYEANRGRPFGQLIERITTIRRTARFGINYLVNAETVSDLSSAADLAFDLGAVEMLLLPEVTPTGAMNLDAATHRSLETWIDANYGAYRLSISSLAAHHVKLPWLPVNDPAHPDRELMHIDASGMLRSSAFADTGARICEYSTLSEAIGALRISQQSNQGDTP
jgi:MoaA/NifB/PqqE/SkfB family radical SAM enzyme